DSTRPPDALPTSLVIRVVRILPLFEVVVRVAQGRRDHVLSAGPLPQIDGAAALAAEREFRIRTGHRILTDRTTQLDRWLGHTFVEELRVEQTTLHKIRATRS